jgi:Uncharacterized protein conserved in bacteria (DUF2188)
MDGDVHLLPAGDGWAIAVEGHNGWSVYPTQDKAVRVGRKLAEDNCSELVIHWRHDPPVRYARTRRRDRLAQPA